MTIRVLRKMTNLEIRKLQIRPHLARRLPASLARRYHAIPVAEENGHITVAMADPEDLGAREAVVSSLGLDAYLIKGDGVELDALIEQIWSENSPSPSSLELLIYAPSIRTRRVEQSGILDPNEICAYTQAIGSLLNAHVTRLPSELPPDAQVLVKEARGFDCDLLVCGAPGRSLFKRLPTSLLVVQSIHLPIKRILLLVKGQEEDEIALDWVLRLAHPSRAHVTVLVILPPVPLMYLGLEKMQYRLPELLTAETSLGGQLRQIAQKLADGEIEGNLRLRTGTFEMEIQTELETTSYDLVVLPADSPQPLRYWLFDGLVESLIRATDRPVLIARAKAL